MIHRLVPTVGDVFAIVGLAGLAVIILVGVVWSVREDRADRRRAASRPVADRWAQHRPRR